MHPTITKRRNRIATDRIEAAMAALVDQYGVGADALEAYQEARRRRGRTDHERAIMTMATNEAIADFVTVIEKHLQSGNEPPKDLAGRIAALPGIAPEKVDEVIAALNAA